MCSDEPTSTDASSAGAKQAVASERVYAVVCPRCSCALDESAQTCPHCDAQRPDDGWRPLAEVDSPWVGCLLDNKFEVLRRIGAGTMGEVYQAASRTIARDFAVKIIDPSHDVVPSEGPETLRERIAQEVRVQSQLRNPHIVQLFEVLTLPGDQLALVMDLVHGLTLEELVSTHGPLAPGRACELLRQTANGVHEAHEAGLVHRDLKPSNLMIEVMPSGDDFVHVFDFGIACLQEESSDDTRFVGTPLFASPEQARGDDIDRRSDIYSLGAVFFYMLTGQPPFPGDQPEEVLLAHCRQQPPTLSEAGDGVQFPSPIEALVARMLAKRKEERPDTLAQLVAELDGMNLGTGASASIPAKPDSLGQRESAVTVRSEPIDESESDESGEPTADTSAPAAQILRAPSGEPTSLSGPSQPGPSGADQTPAQAHEAEDTRLQRSTDGLGLAVREVVVPTTMAGCPWATTPDGRVVFVDKHGCLRLVDPQMDTEWSIDMGLEVTPSALTLARSTAFVGTAPGSVVSFGVTDSEISCLYESPYDAAVESIAVDPKGHGLALAMSNGEVRYARIDQTSDPAWRRVQSNTSRARLAVSADGGTLAILSGARRVLCYTTDWPHERLAEVDLPEPVHSIQLTSDAGKLVAVTQDWQLGVWRLPSGEPLAPLVTIEGLLAVSVTEDDELVVLRTDRAAGVDG